MKFISKKPEQAIHTIEYIIDNNLESDFMEKERLFH